MDLWTKQTGNVAGSELHGKLATNSEAVCLNHRAICLFWRGSPALIPYWLYDRMTLLYKKWKQQLTHTAASVPKPVITDGAQLLQGIQWYLLPSGHESAGAVAAADASVSAEQLKPIYIIQAGAGACGRW